MTPISATDVEFGRLRDVPEEAVIELMNDDFVRRHLPLAEGHFGPSEYREWLTGKEGIWNEHGFGPWAFLVNGRFVGWGGPQPEGKDVDVGLVLRRRFWGVGIALYRRLLDHAFDELGRESVITLLPTSRTRASALGRLGFVPDGTATIDDVPFVRFRLRRADAAWRTG